jgi:hypothetical protein
MELTIYGSKCLQFCRPTGSAVRERVFSPVLVMKVVILVFLSVVALVSCSGGRAAYEFYVVIKSDEAAKFIGAVTAIAKEDGLETATGQAVSDTGNVLKVVEGRGHGLTLWVQSTPLSGKEDTKLCGVHPEPHPDPALFTVFTVPRFFASNAAATELGERVLSQLKSGFDVRREPAICGAAVVRDHS